MNLVATLVLTLISVFILGLALGSIIEKAFGEEIQSFEYATVYLSSNTNVSELYQNPTLIENRNPQNNIDSFYEQVKTLFQWVKQ